MRISLGDVSLWFDVSGPSVIPQGDTTVERPVLVAVHGGPVLDHMTVKSALEPLAADFQVLYFDLRGHGMSQAPPGPEHYTDDRLWADDLAAIIDRLGLERAVLVGWSYGAFAICDYLRAYGQDRVAAINFVEGAVKMGEAAFGTLIGPGFLDHFVELTADDLPANIRGMRSFLRACLAKPVAAEDFETALCWNMVVAPQVRAGLGAREIDDDDVLRGLGVPLLVTQGRSDTVVLPAMAEHVLATCPTAEASWYDGVGHVPHLEEPGRFNRELAALARRVQV